MLSILRKAKKKVQRWSSRTSECKPTKLPILKMCDCFVFEISGWIVLILNYIYIWKLVLD